jgi:hypothetical protein
LIHEIYAKQVRDGVENIDLTMLNIYKGAMGQFMEMFLDHKVQENALGKLSAAEKKHKRHQAGMTKKACGDQISAGPMAITDGYAIVPECLAWAHCTRLKKERKANAKEIAGRIECMWLKEKVE